ncbi:MAG: gliding motility-associated C-terminal domain-containing protein [Nitrospirota bacterium]|nr:gliding motility-associated C-terminal domain-containing protein [Nitrospirota bacterium]
MKGILRPVKICLVLLLVLPVRGYSQDTFQKVYQFPSPDGGQFYDGITTSDGGYAAAGLGSNGSGQELMVTRLNCVGQVLWVHNFGATSSINNISTRIVEADNGDLVVAGTIGNWGSNTQDILVVRMTTDGTIVWKKKYGGNKNDICRGIVPTSDGGFAITGGTASYGSDAGSNSYYDVFIIKLDLDGNVIWSNTYGNPSAVDDGNAIDQDPTDGSLVVTGRYIVNGTFYTYVLKADGSNGDVTWFRAYGKDNNGNFGYGILAASDGSYVITGSTTNYRVDYLSYGDPFVIKVDAATGDTLWTKIYAPSDDWSDNASGIVEDADGNYAISVAGMSYSSFTQGFVPNKHILVRLASNGDLLSARLYNNGGSHYPFIRKASDGGFVYTGFSNFYADNGNTWEGTFFKTDQDFNSGCNETDVTAFTSAENVFWNVEDATYISGQGFTSTVQSGFTDGELPPVNTLCETIIPLEAMFSYSGICAGDEAGFSDLSTGNVVSWNWDFGNDQTSILPNPGVTYEEAGTYDVTLIVGSGCIFDTLTQQIVIQPLPVADAGPDYTIIIGESVTIGGAPTAPPNSDVAWDGENTLDDFTDPNPEASPEETTIYVVTVIDENGCIAQDAVTVFVVPEPPDTDGNLFIPNIFSPNGDMQNDYLRIYGGPFTNLKMEIFNRWGQKVYETDTQMNSGWDGRFSGAPSPIGAYFFQFSAIDKTGSTVTRKGSITLMR